MHKNFKLVDFSNIYSPQNRTTRNHIINSKSPNLSKRTKMSPSPPSTNSARGKVYRTSLLSPKNKLKISEIPQINQIRKANKLTPS